MFLPTVYLLSISVDFVSVNELRFQALAVHFVTAMTLIYT